ncbi:hypothetical protein RAM61_11085 [Enterococcus faecium]|nr:hypothetical protein [Enterococcus faecium]
MELDTQLNASDRSTRETISENFQKIQAAYNDFQNQIVTVSDRLDKLDVEKATHDDVEELRQSLQKRINHLYAGDPQTIKTVVTEALEENGLLQKH